MTSDPHAPTEATRTRRVVRTERRQRPYRWGIGLQILGVLLILVGALTSTAISGAEVFADAGRARLGEPIRFDAEERAYVIVLLRGATDVGQAMDVSVAQADCTVTLADGTTFEPTDSTQIVAERSDFGATVATFDAIAGPTTVVCEGFVGLVLNNYAVAPYRLAAKLTAWALVGAGVVVTVIGAVLMTIGIRGRPVVERVAV